MNAAAILDEVDRCVVRAMAAGLPLVPRPYHTVAEALGIAPDEVMARVKALMARGAIRRIGAVPNHYALGYRSNGMTVWDVDDERVDALGSAVGALEYVTHCYRRPRHRPLWPYNLFAMVHGKECSEVERKAGLIAVLLGPAARAGEILYSTRILKKTGLRLPG